MGMMKCVTKPELQEIASSDYLVRAGTLSQWVSKTADQFMRPSNWGFDLLTRCIHLHQGTELDDNASTIAHVAQTAQRIFYFLSGLAVTVIFSLPYVIGGALDCASMQAGIHPIGYRRNEDLPDRTLNPGEALNVLTYNTGLMCQSFSTINHLRHPSNRMPEIVETINQGPHIPDIVCLQEVLSPTENIPEITERLSKIYPHILHSADESLLLSQGTLFASKFPIEEARVGRYESTMDDDALMNKGFTMALVKLNDEDHALVVNTHLQSSPGSERTAVRREQIAFLQKELTQYEADLQERGISLKGGVFVNGDLNLHDSDVAPGEREKHLHPEFFSRFQEPPTHATSTFYDMSERKTPQGNSSYGQSQWDRKLSDEEKLDYILLDSKVPHALSDGYADIIPDQGERSGCSDHLPYLASFIYKKPSEEERP